MASIRPHDEIRANSQWSIRLLRAEFLHLLMRQLEKLTEHAEFMHQFKSRGMDRVAAKVTQKIGMLLEHDDINAGASQQETHHHPGRTTADDTATGLHGV